MRKQNAQLLECWNGVVAVRGCYGISMRVPPAGSQMRARSTSVSALLSSLPFSSEEQLGVNLLPLKSGKLSEGEGRLIHSLQLGKTSKLLHLAETRPQSLNEQSLSTLNLNSLWGNGHT